MANQGVQIFHKLKKALEDRLDPFPYRRYTDKYKCIFIHIPKTAGTSVLKAIGDGKVQRDHASYTDYLKADPKKFDEYFKFTFTRNPWDKLASAYFYFRTGGNKTLADQSLAELFNSKYSSFERFAMEYLDEDKLRKVTLFRTQCSFVCDSHGKNMMDYTGRFENLNEDFAYIANKLNITQQLKQINVVNDKKKHYSTYYTDTDLIKKVGELYRADCETFGYKFEKD